MSAPGLVDTHAHLMDAAFDSDRDAVYERARQARVMLIAVGYDLATSRSAVDLARRLPGVWAAVGIHPNFAGESRPEDFATVAELSRAPEVIAIGETGLDYYRQHTSPDGQRRAFTWHLALAEDRHLPVIVHNRQADADVVRLTGDHHVSGVLHCFTSTDARYLEHMLARGYYVSFAGPLTFKNASETRAMAAIVPPDRLLVETDCPYLAPVPNRGRRNEPAFVRHTAACLADTLGVSFDTMVDTLWTNTRNAFPILARDQVAA